MRAPVRDLFCFPVQILYEKQIYFWKNDEQMPFDNALLQINCTRVGHICIVYIIYILVYKYLLQLLYRITTIINKI